MAKHSSQDINNKSKEKYTILLYLRMLLAMIVSLYIGLVVVDALEQVGYGIYKFVVEYVLVIFWYYRSYTTISIYKDLYNT